MHKQIGFCRFAILVSVLWVVATCSSPPDTTSKTVLRESEGQSTPQTNPFERLEEGFINANTFQVVVSSLKIDAGQAEEEARTVAEKKSFQLLQTYPQKPLTPKGRTELKEISESGKIVQRGKVGDKKYFVYQIQRSGLRLLVETRLP